MTKKCSRCREIKTLDNFHKKSKNKDGYGIYCKSCKSKIDEEYRIPRRLELSEKAKNYYKENPERCKEKAYFYNLKNKEATNEYKYWWRIFKVFGITKEEYNEKLKEQDYKCQICKSDNPKSKRLTKFIIDHCHTTGKVRGLLCNSCNNAIGHLNDSVETLENAITYLKKYK